MRIKPDYNVKKIPGIYRTQLWPYSSFIVGFYMGIYTVPSFKTMDLLYKFI
jgi:hypothetical protein